MAARKITIKTVKWFTDYLMEIPEQPGVYQAWRLYAGKQADPEPIYTFIQAGDTGVTMELPASEVQGMIKGVITQ